MPLDRLGSQKKTRSPDWSPEVEVIFWPAPLCHWLVALWGRLTPICWKQYMVKPEQSKPLGDAPP